MPAAEDSVLEPLANVRYSRISRRRLTSKTPQLEA